MRALLQEAWATLMVRLWTRRGIRAAARAVHCKAKQVEWTAWLDVLRGGTGVADRRGGAADRRDRDLPGGRP